MSHPSRRGFLKAASLAGFELATRHSPFLFGKSTGGAFSGNFQPTWDSLTQYKIPEWYTDAKFGIFIHWGIYSVPAHDREWYPRLMYLRDNPVFEWHRQHWGPQSMFGYKDFVPMFTAARWNPDEWVELFRRAGAKYVVPVGEHHDGFPMYDCMLSDWTAAKMGPRRDVVGELGRAIRNQGLKFGVSSHRAFHWSYYTFADDFDTTNPLYAGLYGPIHAPTPFVKSSIREMSQTVSAQFLQDWFARTVGIVDQYQPDLMWFDFGFESPEFEASRKQFAAYYYNQQAKWSRGVVINYKHDAYPEDAAVLDIERGFLDKTRSRFWQTDTSVGRKSWGYISNEEYKSADEIVDELVDIVSKNGCLLLNVGPKPDGTIPDEAKNILLAIGRWLEVNGKAIYGTRPWKVYGEGPTKRTSGYFSESHMKGFTGQDIRFTTDGSSLYVIALAWPGRELSVKSLAASANIASQKIADVKLLGYDGNLKWKQSDESMTVEMPDKQYGNYAFTFKVTFKS
jgi:alpha-L-fucosidase